MTASHSMNEPLKEEDIIKFYRLIAQISQSENKGSFANLEAPLKKFFLNPSSFNERMRDDLILKIGKSKELIDSTRVVSARLFYSNLNDKDIIGSSDEYQKIATSIIQYIKLDPKLQKIINEEGEETSIDFTTLYQEAAPRSNISISVPVEMKAGQRQHEEHVVPNPVNPPPQTQPKLIVANFMDFTPLLSNEMKKLQTLGNAVSKEIVKIEQLMIFYHQRVEQLQTSRNSELKEINRDMVNLLTEILPNLRDNDRKDAEKFIKEHPLDTLDFKAGR